MSCSKTAYLKCDMVCLQRDSSQAGSATEDRAQFAGFGVTAQGHGLRPTPFKSPLERLSIPLSEAPSESTSASPSPAGHKQVIAAKTATPRGTCA